MTKRKAVKKVAGSAAFASRQILAVLAFKVTETALHATDFGAWSLAALAVLSLLIPANIEKWLEEID